MQQRLDSALERPRPEEGIEAYVGEESLGLLGHIQPDFPVGHATREKGDLDVDYREDAVLGQTLEHDCLVDAVDELGLEGRPQQAVDAGPHLRHVLGFEDDVGAQVARHDDDGVLEVDDPALSVGEAAVVQELEQDVEDVRMGLLDLVEE